MTEDKPNPFMDIDRIKREAAAAEREYICEQLRGLKDKYGDRFSEWIKGLPVL